MLRALQWPASLTMTLIPSAILPVALLLCHLQDTSTAINPVTSPWPTATTPLPVTGTAGSVGREIVLCTGRQRFDSAGNGYDKQ